ncbi:uncharacterized protein PHALS_05272 [Plasmopara halstedii]|uniref:Uncharacterized protein n=1 Tax=Plasmopara halstedii TaxID=4781 RepID=A0A0P1B357_PLAHL|nr:uncharacterized protein PHALS_05272 [Plasmopara halstedii]CEG47949.1 hypothetical protein PHALS_05272 [Plasmopara halstedii]|eukprot:XP_024584318.1 hypothetical protein PHALS_05272 [Plasmopara halstedii]
MMESTRLATRENTAPSELRVAGIWRQKSTRFLAPKNIPYGNDTPQATVGNHFVKAPQSHG